MIASLSENRLSGVSGGRRSPAYAPAVALADVTISFQLTGGGRYPAVERATLAIADGEFVSIVGPTGCGKSTLLNAAAGLIAPSAGRVEVFAQPLAGINRQSGYLFQADALFPWKTALENVAIALEIDGVARSEARSPRTDAGSPGWDSARSATAIRTCSPAASASASGSRRC